MTKEQEIARARRAQEIMEDPLFEEIMEGAKQAFIKEWIDTPYATEQATAWAKVHALDAVRTQFRRVIATGEYAQAALTKTR